MRGVAKERIPYGAHVLCRNFEVRLAPPEIANGTANSKPAWGYPRGAHDPGDCVMVTPVEGLGDRDLNVIANGPIMEPLKLYLPAGKLSEAEYQDRLALDYERCGILPDERGALMAVLRWITHRRFNRFDGVCLILMARILDTSILAAVAFAFAASLLSTCLEYCAERAEA